VPFPEVSDHGARHRAVEPAQAANHVRFADAHGDQCLPLAKVDPCLESLPYSQTSDWQATAIIEEQFGVFEITGSAPGKHQVPAQPAG
jgi:hypothetical protein